MTLQSVFGSKVSGNGSSQEKFVIEPSEYHESDKTSFAKHLRWKMKTRDVEWMDVTPMMAEEMMKYNERNRPLTETTARKYGRLMKAGKWGYKGKGTCEPIIFSDKGRILSAQHRLQGAILEGATFRALIVFGEPDENFAYIDQGRRRTAGDVFAINGVPNYEMAAAVTRWLVSYERGQVGSAHASSSDLSNDEAYAAYCAYGDMQSSLRIGGKYNREGFPHPSVAAAIHYLCAQRSRIEADEYFTKVSTGLGLTREREPAKKVRDLLRKATLHESANVTRKMVAAYLIKGWNCTRAGRTMTRVDFDVAEPIR